jgi:hypothetical protein
MGGNVPETPMDSRGESSSGHVIAATQTPKPGGSEALGLLSASAMTPAPLPSCWSCAGWAVGGHREVGWWR